VNIIRNLKTTLIGLALTAPLYAPTIAEARSSWSGAR
jgi:hypothetical protein